MKNSFKEYYGLDPSELDKLWNDGIIVFDTNVLLSLYRRSEDVRNDFISMIRSLKDRIWLPHQVGYEYHEHRLEEAMRPIEALQAVIGKIQKFEKDFEQDYNNNPYLDTKKIQSAFKTFSSRIDKLIQISLSSCPDFLHEDGILSVLTELFDGKMGPEYQEKVLSDIYRVGNERYSNKIPPGYKDTKKHEGERHRFGDLIIWLQIIEYAKTSGKDIIFVTDDKKEDWWEEYKDNRIGPRYELIREFRSSTNNRLIWFYTPDRFLQNAKSKAGIPVKPKTIEEIKRPVSDGAAIFAQSTLPGQVSKVSQWPVVSSGEFGRMDVESSSLLANRVGATGVFYPQNFDGVLKNNRIVGITDEGRSLGGADTKCVHKEPNDSISKKKSKPIRTAPKVKETKKKI